MDDECNVNVQVSSQFTQFRNEFFLERENLEAFGLVGKQELHVVDANQLDVVLIDSHVDCFQQQVHCSGTVETHEVEWELGESIEVLLEVFGVLSYV